MSPLFNYTSFTYDCQNCSARNCLACSNSGCSRCQVGFVSSSNNSYYYYSGINATCRKCSIYCSSCDPNDITRCLNCSKGLEMRNGRCEPCPQNCLTCKGASCVLCVEGLTPNSNNVCVPNCKLPCITCVDNQTSSCTSCQKGSTLINGTCVLDMACNNDSSCKYCGQGLNYFLNPMSATGGKCLQCPSIPNCLQCNELFTSSCMICADGFFANTAGQCSPCPSNCSQCVNDKTCTACQTGWTLYDVSPEGQCFECKSPCASCIDEPWFCLSCVSGFTKKGWMCLNDSHLTFNFTLSARPLTILSEIDNVTDGLFSLLNYAHNDSSIITIGTVTETSSRETIVDGYIAPFEGSYQNASVTLANDLLGGIPGVPYSVSSIQVGSAQVNGSSVGINATLNATSNPTGDLRRPFVGPYINFTEPINTTSYGYNGTSALGDHFQWLYASFNASQNTTTVKVFQMDNSAPLPYNETSFTVQAEFHILAHSQKCLVLYEPSNWYSNGSTIKMFR